MKLYDKHSSSMDVNPGRPELELLALRLRPDFERQF